MPRNFILGIGGTGARCVESLLHLCTSGLGPDNLWVGFIDQDAGHANLDTARTVLRQVDQLRAWFCEDEKNRAGLKKSFSLWNTELWAAGGRASALSPSDPVAWYPAPADTNTPMTFEGIFSWSTADTGVRSLMQALYRRGPDDLEGERDEIERNNSEHRMLLDAGFRGRPSLGAAIMLDRQEADPDGFWHKLHGMIEDFSANRRDEPARVLLVGSVFGGTGAGGLPVLARRLRRTAAERKWKLDVSCVLVGPYFRYELTHTKHGLHADPAEFNAKLRGAFQYYANLLSREPVFGRVYLVGWPNRFDFGGDRNVDRNGRGQQRNPSTLPELYAGLAATDYFRADTLTRGTTRIYGTSFTGESLSTRDDPTRRDDGAWFITWRDLPSPPGIDAPEMRRRLGSFIRFCMLFQTVFRDTLRDSALRRSIEGETWFRFLLGPEFADKNNLDVSARLALLGEYAEHALRWWGGIALLNGTPEQARDLPKELIRADLFASVGHDRETKTVAIEVANDLPRSTSRARFARLMRDEGDAPTLSGAFRTLSQAKPSNDAHGLGRFIRSLYDSVVT